MNRRTFLGIATILAAIPNSVMTATAKARVSLKPKIYGKFLNVPPLYPHWICNEDLLSYQMPDEVHSVHAVRDGGMELVFDGDDDDVKALTAADIKPGHYRTCMAQGCFRLGAYPVFQLTIDGEGDGLRPRVTRMDELAGAVRDGSYSAEWLAEIKSQGLLVSTF